MSLSFKNRIAFHYMLATALIMGVIFSIVYFIVQSTVLRHLDNDLTYEAEKHIGEISYDGDSILFINKREWEEREHREIQVNPVFIQLIDDKGQMMDKSPNLKEDQLKYNKSAAADHFDAVLNDRSIRQVQIPITNGSNVKGYIMAAMSSESTNSVLKNLRNVLIASYLIVLAGLYFVSRFLAGRSIKPIQEITSTITRITRNNLNERVGLPPNKDEIYALSSNFNGLLERIESALEREKQFTSDASHELRTPLATLRGTLEVLVRKPRSKEEYEEKINYSLAEIERMTTTLEQLLLLARLDTKVELKSDNQVSLPTLIDESLTRFSKKIAEKELKINFEFDNQSELQVPHFYSSLIVDNVINNAIKYSKNNTSITIKIENTSNGITCSITDQGIGIKAEDLDHIYKNFFRSGALEHKHISGQGLGLSIVKKCADAIQAKLDIKSEIGKGTNVTISF